ncbi:MAG: hypothetical protein J5671_08140 [Bacteroidaceae bacterium]|nr:hypothetical protein [Bacteroidaceae bacterium]
MAKQQQKKQRKPLLISATLVLFIAVWLWAWLWYGDVFRIAREYSFWAPDQTLMRYMEGRPWGALWMAGLALLQLFRWPILGGAIIAILVSGSTWLIGYCLRLRGWWRLLQYIPAALFLSTIAYIGFDLYFETETGRIMGIPLLCFAVLLVLALVIRSFSHTHKFPPILLPYKDETPRQNHIQWLACVVCVVVAMGISQWVRPDVRVTTRMQRQMLEQDWRGMAETARAHSELSYRSIAAYYAIALVQTVEQGDHLFDIRLDYDTPYMHNFNIENNSQVNYYLMDCDFHAGLIATANHHAMEHLTMNGPTLRSLKMLTKCALLKGEWEVAEKYLFVLKHVPFEGKWVEKYQTMLRNQEKVDADPEFRMVRLTEPIHDNFENFYTPPTFLGYNLSLTEGRSINALYNSLVVHIYTKSMPFFIARCEPLVGTTPPQSIAEALALLSGKYTEIPSMFPTLSYNRPRLTTFLQEVQPYLNSFEARQEHALELFPKWKGYYPYYYFFGNLKSTRGHTEEDKNTSKQGVN